MPIFTNDASVHIQIKPDDFDQGYLMVFKKNDTPNYNVSTKNYDYLKILCPNSTDIVDDGNDTYYLFFMNIAQIGGYKGQAGFGIRELTPSEQIDYCGSEASDQGGLFLNISSTEEPPYLEANYTLTFNSDFEIRIFSSGCYYFDLPTGYWKSDGMEILRDTTATSAHCVATHLTDFAGGFAAVTPSINFAAAFANASFLDNPVIYSTMIGITLLYIIIAIVSHRKDRLDRTRFNIVPLPDNKPEDNYFYELVVLTGSRAESGTKSKVRIIITGEEGETDIRLLNGDLPYAFSRGSVDSFVLSTNKPLGSLNYVRVWHDNSGKKASASWFLKNILVHDLQSREKYYFFCQRWLAVERDDGQIDRVSSSASFKSNEFTLSSRYQVTQL